MTYMKTTTNTVSKEVIFEETDGTIANCLLHATGSGAWDYYTFYDLVAERFGKTADIMRACMEPGAKTVRVRFEMTGEDKFYTDLAAAKRAIIRLNHKNYGHRSDEFWARKQAIADGTL
jgi:hypothetical protein